MSDTQLRQTLHDMRSQCAGMMAYFWALKMNKQTQLLQERAIECCKNMTEQLTKLSVHLQEKERQFDA